MEVATVPSYLHHYTSVYRIQVVSSHFVWAVVDVQPDEL